MNDFDYENLQKKRVARGAFAHISRKRGKCRLPSDFLTPAQRKEKNGEAKTYNIMRPMPIADFNGMAEDMQREYIRNMQGFGATAAWLAPRMGCSANMARNRAESLGAMMPEMCEVTVEW